MPLTKELKSDDGADSVPAVLGSFGVGMRDRPDPWFARGSCSPSTAHLFFPSEKGKDPYRDARVLCLGCSVRLRCLEAALEEEEASPDARRYGMRGGLTPREREELYRERRALAR